MFSDASELRSLQNTDKIHLVHVPHLCCLLSMPLPDTLASVCRLPCINSQRPVLKSQLCDSDTWKIKEEVRPHSLRHRQGGGGGTGVKG